MFDRSKRRCLHCKQSLTKSKSYGCSITPEGSEEHLLRLYQDSGGREPNDRRRRYDGLWWTVRLLLILLLWVTQKLGERRRGDRGVRPYQSSTRTQKGLCIPGFFKWPWPQVVEKAPNWGVLGPQSRSINNSNVKKENG